MHSTWETVTLKDTEEALIKEGQLLQFCSVTSPMVSFWQSPFILHNCHFYLIAIPMKAWFLLVLIFSDVWFKVMILQIEMVLQGIGKKLISEMLFSLSMSLNNLLSQYSLKFLSYAEQWK